MEITVKLSTPVTVCGLAGVGKSTVLKIMEKELGFSLHSSGDFARELACERFPGLEKSDALAALEELAKTDKKIDLMIDQRAVELAKRPNGAWILDSRLGWHFCPHTFKVLLDCDTLTRLKRIAGRDGCEFSEAYYKTEHRESAIRDRYKKYYGISDFTNPRLFDYVAHTSILSAEEVAIQVLDAYKEWHRNHTAK